MKWIGPKTKDAHLRMLIWEVHRIHQAVPLEVGHVNARRLKRKIRKLRLSKDLLNAMKGRISWPKRERCWTEEE